MPHFAKPAERSWTHRSGRKSLVLGCTARHITDMDYRQSAELPVRLQDWATQPQYVYRHQWSVGDLVIWDNTGITYRAMPYDPDSGRLLTRTKLEGDEPFARHGHPRTGAGRAAGSREDPQLPGAERFFGGRNT